MAKTRLNITPKRRRKNRFPNYVYSRIRTVVKVLVIFMLGAAILFMGDKAGMNFRPIIIADAYKVKSNISPNLYGYSIDSEFKYDENLLNAAKNSGAKTFRLFQGVDPGARFLAKVEQGDYKILASDNVPYSPNQEYKLRIEVKDNNIKLFIDEQKIFDINDNTFATGEIGLLSFYNLETAFDDLTVKDLNNNVLFADDFNSWFLKKDWNNADIPDLQDTGDWKLLNNKLVHLGKQDLAIKTAGSKNWKNDSIETKIKSTSKNTYDQGFMGISFRQNGVYDSYRFLWRGAERQPQYSARPWEVADFAGQLKFSQDGGFTPIMVVNMRGTADEAANLVRRLNVDERRNIKYWELGNEVYMYGDGYMPAENYAQKVVEFSSAMKAVDPSIKVGANVILSFGNWEEILFKNAAKNIDFVIFHFYPFWVESNISNAQLLASPNAFSNNYKTSYGQDMGVVGRTKDLLKQYAPDDAKRMEFVITEFNIGDYQKGISMIYGLTVADLLGKMTEDNVKIGLFHKLAAEDGYQWGAFNADHSPKPAALAIELFAKHFGEQLLNTYVINSPKFSNKEKLQVPAMSKTPYLSAFTSRNKEKNKLYMIVVNKHSQADIKTLMFINNAKIKSRAKIWTLNSADILSSNYSGSQNVKINESQINNASNSFKYTFPAHSVTTFEFDVKIKKTKKVFGGNYLKKVKTQSSKVKTKTKK